MHPSRSSESLATGSLKRLSGGLLFCSLFTAVLLFAGVSRAQTPEEEETARPEESAPVKPTPEPARSIVRGRVIYDDTNRPVRRARVMLLRSDGKGGTEKTGKTDERGEFRIESVAAGDYFVAVDMPGIISPFSQIDLGEIAMNEKAALISMRKDFDEVSVNGTNSVEVRIRAKRGGAITGRVAFADGDPAINVPITILRKKDNRLVRFITSFSPSAMMGVRTDDRGIYRIAGLPPGEYIIGAAEAYGREDEREDYPDYMLFGKGALSTSYYQNETNPRQATIIKVEAGQEANDINITLIERATYTISGTVVARQARKPLKARINIYPKNEEGQNPFSQSGPDMQTDAQGNWSIPNVPDGSYVITVEPVPDYDLTIDDIPVTTSTQSAPGRQRPLRPTTPSYAGQRQEVTVSGADLSGIVIELAEGGRLEGTLIVEGNKKLQGGTGVALVALGVQRAVEKSSYAGEDGRFVIDGIPPGEFYLKLPGLGEGYYVKSMTAGGTDLLREPLRFGQGTNITNALITISNEVAILTGRVLSSEDNKPVRGASVLVVPSDAARWRLTNNFLYASTDSAGNFKITGAPGTYLVIPLARGEQLRVLDEAFIRQHTAAAKQITLQPNGREAIELIAPAERQE